MQKILLLLLGGCLAVNFAYPADPVAPATKIKRMDLDGDGTMESQVTFEAGKITLATSDKNFDRTVDATIHYKNGFRDNAEIDTNFDGKPDMWVKYYFSGIPDEIDVDRNFDGRVDYWKFFQNGFVYKKEWDRNQDGKPDYRVIYEAPTDLRGEDPDRKQTVQKSYDDNFDGSFEKELAVTRHRPQRRVGIAAGEVEEVEVD